MKGGIKYETVMMEYETHDDMSHIPVEDIVDNAAGWYLSPNEESNSSLGLFLLDFFLFFCYNIIKR